MIFLGSPKSIDPNISFSLTWFRNVISTVSPTGPERGSGRGAGFRVWRVNHVASVVHYLKQLSMVKSPQTGAAAEGIAASR
jgi:hypothetical protein